MFKTYDRNWLQWGTCVKLSDQATLSRQHEEKFRARRSASSRILTQLHTESARHLPGTMKGGMYAIGVQNSSWIKANSFESGDIRDNDDNIIQYHRYALGLVMVWAGISWDGHTELHAIDGGSLARIFLMDWPADFKDLDIIWHW